MRPFLSGLFAVAVFALAQAHAQFQYPDAPRAQHAETFHGQSVPDPYVWLEDPAADASRSWIESQNEITYPFLESIEERDAIQSRLTELWNYERYGTPTKRGGRYFFSRNDGLQNQSVMYVSESLDDEPRVLLDPNSLSEDGTISLGGWSISPDGRYVAYAISDGGSDWRTWKVRDVNTGRDLPDEVNWAKFSGASWSADSGGFYYSRYDAPKEGDELQGANYFQKLYYHRLITDQSEDQLVYARFDHRDWGFGGYATEDGRYLIISVWQGTERKNRLFYKPLGEPDAEVVELIPNLEAEYAFVGNDGPVFYFRTDLNAPRGRLIAIDTTNPDKSNWRELVPQREETLQGVSLLGDRFFCSYLADAHTQVRIHGTDGTDLGQVAFPGLGTAGGFGGERHATETFYSYTSFTTPSTIYRYDLATGDSEIFKRPSVKFDPGRYEVKQVFYSSHDGTRVPMFIAHRKGLSLDGTNPTLLYSYGGFNISLTPSFSVTNLVWMEMGGVYAMPNIRGGGEYGKEWHDAGRLLNKKNSFLDFIAAAEWLIGEGYTSPERLAIRGGSNGGLLVGACMTMRPELFGAALPAVGVMDMLKFDQWTIGWAWRSDYGHPSENKDDFEYNLSYSPYHNLKPGTDYPATMVTTADRDDRVVPAHSFKFAAALQHAHGGSDPVLIRIETRAGHGAGTPTSKRIEQSSDMLAFLAEVLDIEPERVRID